MFYDFVNGFDLGVGLCDVLLSHFVNDDFVSGLQKIIHGGVEFLDKCIHFFN
jgi:hypothetical protein